MPANDYFEEEEFTARVNTRTVWRILGLTRNYKWWVFGFLFSVTIVSLMDSSLTFVSKMIVDDAIVPADRARLYQLLSWYFGMGILQAMIGYVIERRVK